MSTEGLTFHLTKHLARELIVGQFEDADASAYIERMASAPTSEQESIYRYFISQSKSIGVWEYITDCGFLCAHDIQAAKLGVKDIINLSNVGTGPSHVPGWGMAGNGTSQALSTGYVIPNGSQNDASLGCYSLDQFSENAPIMGNVNSLIGARHSSTPDTFFHRINSASSGSSTEIDPVGFYIANRLNSTNTKAWKHGSEIDDQVVSSDTPDATYPIYVCGRNGATPEYSSRLVAFWHIGAGIPEALIPSYSALVETVCSWLASTYSILDISEETKALYRNLITQSRKPSFYFGGFDNTYYHSTGMSPLLIDDIQQITGRVPKIASHEWPDTAGIDAAEAVLLAARIKEDYSQGIVTALHHHSGNPVTGSFEQKITIDDGTTGNTYDLTGNPVTNCLSGGSARTDFLDYCDRVSTWLNSLTTDSGTRIPVILRFFHEANGGWFWWSADGGAAYQQMWQDFVDRLSLNGVTNVLFDFNRSINTTPNATYYPGNDYCDILSGDFYDNDASVAGFSQCLSAFLALTSGATRGKPKWIAEFGYSDQSATDSNIWSTKSGFYHRDRYSLSFGCLVWRSPWGPAFGDSNNSDLVALFDDSSCLTIDLPDELVVNTVLPAISGTEAVGYTLTATTGTWDNFPSSYSYQWERSGAPISGATNSTYLLDAADEGETLTVVVTATNDAGSVSAESAATGAIAATAPPFEGHPTLATGIATWHELNTTDWLDSVGTKHLTATGTVTVVDGGMNKAAGANYLSGDGIDSGPYSQLSISAWVKTSTASLKEVAMASEYNSSASDRSFSLGLGTLSSVDCRPRFLATDDGGSIKKDYFGPSDIGNNTWRHVAVTFNSGTIVMYVDGSSVTTTKNSDSAMTQIRDATAGFSVGMINAGTTWTGACQVKQVGKWTRVLTAGEVADLYASGVGLSY